MGEHEPVVSHGRGGQGNIGADSTPYVDGGIVREGAYGDQGDGAYSAGVRTYTRDIPTPHPPPIPEVPHLTDPQRGGAGNIGSPHVRPTHKTPHDAEVVPELAIRNSGEGDYHVGRGGQGNVHLDEEHKKEKEEKKHQKSLAHEGLADKLKHKLLGRK